MSGFRCKISTLAGLVLLVSIQALSQQISYRDSLAGYNSQLVNLKPRLNYLVGSTFMAVPHLGNVYGFTISPELSIPLTPKLSVDGGIIAGHFYSSFGNSGSESGIHGAYNELSLYGSAIYHINSQLTVYGSGIRQITGTSPYSYLPKSSYSIGSSLKFENFSIGVTVQMSKWNSIYTPLPFNGSQGIYFPLEQGPGRMPIY